MMNAWELPVSLCVGGREWKIRTNFKTILDILKCFADPQYEQDEQWVICLAILYEDFENMPVELHNEAAEKALEFIDMGMKDDSRRPRPHLMDWDQDAAVIIPAVNQVLGTEVRTVEYMHWWTFMGAYMEIGESLFSQILHIRQKKAKGKKLEKWELEFYNENKKLIDLQVKQAGRSEEEKNALRELFGF